MSESLFNDIELRCVQCDSPFIWTKGEQAFMNDLFEKGKVSSVNTPKRCKECRAKKHKERNTTPAA